jgi:hypothetical protein
MQVIGPIREFELMADVLDDEQHVRKLKIREAIIEGELALARGDFVDLQTREELQAYLDEL